MEKLNSVKRGYANFKQRFFTATANIIYEIWKQLISHSNKVLFKKKKKFVFIKAKLKPPVQKSLDKE